MEKIDTMAAFRQLCQLRGSWGLMLDGLIPMEIDDLEEWKQGYDKLKTMVPFLQEGDFFWHDSLIILGTEEEINDLFSQVHGDDGPCDEDRSCGRFHVYALTCNEKGELMNENT